MKNKKAFGISRRLLSLPFSERSHSASDLSGTQAAGAGVHTLGGTVNDRLNAADVGLPAAIGTSVGVGHTDTEGHGLATIFTLCHCSAPPFVTPTGSRTEHSLCEDIVSPQSNGNSLADNGEKIKSFLQGLQNIFILCATFVKTLVFFYSIWYNNMDYIGVVCTRFLRR